MDVLEKATLYRCDDGLLRIFQRVFVARQSERWHRCHDRKSHRCLSERNDRTRTVL